MLVQISVAVIAVAFVALTVYIILALKSVRDSLQQANQTLVEVQQQVDQVSRETVKLMRTTNHITEDIHQKIKHVDALFESIGDVGQAVNQFTSSVKQVSATVTQSLTNGVQRGIHSRQEQIDEAVNWVKLAFTLWQKIQNLKSGKSKGENHNVRQ